MSGKGREGGYDRAAALAVEALRGASPAERLASLNVPVEHDAEHCEIRFPFLGRPISLFTVDFALADGRGSMGPQERALILRMIAAARPLTEKDSFISFREFPGGFAYWNIFRSRTVDMLTRRIGNDRERLMRGLSSLPHRMIDTKEIGAEIFVLGDIALRLAYSAGDDEFPPSAEMMFQRSARRILSTEDAVVLASIVCREISFAGG